MTSAERHDEKMRMQAWKIATRVAVVTTHREYDTVGAIAGRIYNSSTGRSWERTP